MNVFELVKAYVPDQIDYWVEDKLGEGVDGEVFDLDDEFRVIKYCIIYDNPLVLLDDATNEIIANLNYVRKNPVKCFASVSEVKLYGTFHRYFRGDRQRFSLYSYVMEKLKPISEDECKLFHSLISHEDRNVKKNYTTEQQNKMIDEMWRWLDIDTDMVKLFCRELNEAAFEHLDLHERNVMKDAKGYYKLVDLDRIKKKG